MVSHVVDTVELVILLIVDGEKVVVVQVFWREVELVNEIDVEDLSHGFVQDASAIPDANKRLPKCRVPPTES